MAYLLGIFQGSTWHSIEVQDEGGHERSLEGEDGDGVGEHHAVGEVLADDQGRRQGNRVGNFAEEKNTK